MFYTSVYISLQPDDRADRPPRYLIRIKDLIKRYREFLKSKDIDPKRLQSVFEDFRKIEEFFEDPKNLESEEGIPVGGVAIFSKSDEDYWEVVKLIYVLRNELVVDIQPYKLGVYAVESDFGKNLVANFSKRAIDAYMLDARSVRHITDNLDIEEVAEKPGVFKTSVADMPVFRTLRAKNMEALKAEENNRVAKAVADYLFQMYKKEPYDNLFLSSPNEKLVPLVYEKLHTYVKRTFRAELQLSWPTNKREVYLAVMEKTRELDVEDEKNLLQRFKDALALEMAVRGLRPAVFLAMMGNVDTLIVDPDFSREGFICHPSGYFSFEGECPADTEITVHTPDITDKLVEEVLRMGGRVEVANTPELRQAIDHSVGAIMRWKMEVQV
ncbi:MAG: hypothetical protein GXO29_06000 [Thermotogae bacterium]|nr:hypothetical protein [Thermotogota bacterium]